MVVSHIWSWVVDAYNYNNDDHHLHQGMLTAQTPLTLSRHPSFLGITLGKSSRWLSVSAQNWWMQIFACQPTLMCICVGVYWRMSLMSSSLLHQQCPACLAHLTWMVCKVRVGPVLSHLKRFVQIGPHWHTLVENSIMIFQFLNEFQRLLLYTIPMNINGYVPILILLFNIPMNI